LEIFVLERISSSADNTGLITPNLPPMGVYAIVPIIYPYREKEGPGFAEIPCVLTGKSEMNR